MIFGAAPQLEDAPTALALPAIDVRGVSKRFGRIDAVHEVSLQVARGSVHGLLGPNGAGKTTVLRMLFGLVRPDRGTVRVLDQSPFAVSTGRVRGAAGFVESPRFYPYLSAARNLDLLASLDGSQSSARVDEVIEVVGLAPRAGDKVAGFSSGMRQRLGIAAALLLDPHLLILDEPTNGLDPAGVQELHALIRALVASGRTVLLSSHDMGEVEQLSDAVTVLRAGRVVYSGGIEQLRAVAPAASFQFCTSDNAAAIALARAHGALDIVRVGHSLEVAARPDVMDDYVCQLGRAGIAVRALACEGAALETLFLRLTATSADG